MKKYRINDLQYSNFMDDTHDEPMTCNALRARFWALDDVRTEKYKEFTRDFICDNWEVEFEKI